MGAKSVPQTPCQFQGAASRQGKGRGDERRRRERGIGEGIGEGKRKGREEGREGKGKEEGKGGEGEFASLALGGIDAPAASCRVCCVLERV